MCESCGCNREDNFGVSTGKEDGTGFHVHRNADGHLHVHRHEPEESSGPIPGGVGGGDQHASTRRLDVRQSVLSANDRQAERNRGFFEARKVRVLNLMSSPGAGKTTLLERTLRDLSGFVRMAVIVGDLATENDARRLRECGAEVIQVTTGTLCHLDAGMVRSAVEALDLDAVDLLFIENVGNLVCPASFDLGESGRVVLLSVTEGEDKPLKYPPIFKAADLVVLTKTDLQEAAGFDRDSALATLQRVAPQARVIEVSSRSGEGLEDWGRYIAEEAGMRTNAGVHVQGNGG
jgi:hydrogenase nickel incorporation protein HypB